MHLIANKGGLCLLIPDPLPVAGLSVLSLTSALLLLRHLAVKALQIRLHALLLEDQFRKVCREAVGVVEFEDDLPGQRFLSLLLRLIDVRLQHLYTGGESPEEGTLLLLCHASDQLLLSHQLGVVPAHALHEGGDEAVHKGLLEIEESVAIPYRAPEDSADNVARSGTGGQLSVGNGKGYRSYVVSDHAHSYVGLLRRTIGYAGDLCDLADEWLEDISVVIGLLPLHRHAKALQPHAGIDDVVRQSLEVTICHAIVLHEDKVPDLDHQRVVLIDEVSARDAGDLFLAPQVDMDLRAGATGTGLAHLPEVIVLVTIKYPLLRQQLCPGIICLLITFQTLLRCSLKDGDIEPILGQPVHLRQQLPSPRDDLLLEVISEGPVPQHLKHGMVVGVVSYGGEVIVLTAHAQALLRVGYPRVLPRSIPQDDVLELIHPRIGKH